MYAKLFTSIYQGTLRGNSHGLLVFTNLLAHADADGCVDVHPKAIAEEVGLPVEVVRGVLEMLESPDEESRSPEMEGRRIIRLDEHRAWGWKIVNHGKYNAIKNEADRREQNRAAQERYRQRRKLIVIESKRPSAESAHIDVDVDTALDVDTPTDSIPGVPPRTPQRRKAASGATRAKRSKAPSAEVFDAYSQAYEGKYGVPPIRNKRVNSQLVQFVERLGVTEAPSVAEFYITHRNQLYVNAKHCVDLMLRDCEKLRTEWATGTQGTHTAAAMTDRTQTNYNAFAPLLAEAAAKERTV